MEALSPYAARIPRRHFSLGWPWGFRPPQKLRATRVALGMDLGLALPTPGPR